MGSPYSSFMGIPKRDGTSLPRGLSPTCKQCSVHKGDADKFRMWHKVAGKLAEKYTVIIPDLRGGLTSILLEIFGMKLLVVISSCILIRQATGSPRSRKDLARI
jgi:hypothetical protein